MSLVGMDFARSFAAQHRAGSATGFVNMGEFGLFVRHATHGLNFPKRLPEVFQGEALFLFLENSPRVTFAHLFLRRPRRRC